MLQIQAGKSVLRFGLVVVDMQNGFVSRGGSYDKLGLNVENYQKAIPLIKELINFCRSIGIPVFYTEAAREIKKRYIGRHYYKAGEPKPRGIGKDMIGELPSCVFDPFLK